MNSKLLAVAGFVVSGVGVGGQTWLLQHELNHTYPYKIMSSPPAEYYFRTADFGIYLSPLIAFTVAVIGFAALRREWTTWVLPVVVCPLAFAAVFLLRDAIWDGEALRNFDGTTQRQVSIEFVTFALGLSIAGGLVAAIAWFVSSRITRRILSSQQEQSP